MSAPDSASSNPEDQQLFEDTAALFVDACAGLGRDLDAEIARIKAATDSQFGRFQLMTEVIMAWFEARQARTEGRLSS
jgi:hypothetical protein